jgi:hypothetical protein
LQRVGLHPRTDHVETVAGRDALRNVFRRVRKIAKNRLLAASCLSFLRQFAAPNEQIVMKIGIFRNSDHKIQVSL